MPRPRRLLLALTAVAACAHAGTAPRAAAPRCAWPAPAEELRRAGDTLWQRYTLPAAALTAAPDLDALPALRAYRAYVATTLGVTDARALLARQAAYWAGRENADERREAANGRALLDGTAGTLRPIGCLEGLLVDAQAARVPMDTRPTELQALVLRRGPMLRVYVGASAAPWPPKLDPVLDAVARDRRDGWTVDAHLHNHPFYLDKRDADVAGANAPSLSDVQFYRSLRASLGLAHAWVTNGFTTSEFSAADFDRLQARP